MNASDYILAATGLCAIGAMFAWALCRRHPEDREREASDRAAEDRASTDGFAQRVDLGTWSAVTRPAPRRPMVVRPVQQLPEVKETK